jgi:hypothetical protein
LVPHPHQGLNISVLIVGKFVLEMLQQFPACSLLVQVELGQYQVSKSLPGALLEGDACMPLTHLAIITMDLHLAAACIKQKKYVLYCSSRVSSQQQ